MSNRYKGGIISATPPTLVAGAGASGTWTLEQQMQANAAGLWPVNGPFYIEDVFSTWLVTGDGSAPAINNGIDLAGKGGMVWLKKRSAAGSNDVFDTARGANLRLITNDTAAQDSKNLSFTSTGFSNYTFDNAVTYASWTFREQPKFFDVVTYTGNGDSFRVLAHSLSSTPGCIIVKRTDSTGNWAVFHRASGGANKLSGFNLNSTFAAQASGDFSGVTDTTFMPANVFSWNGSSLQGSNINGATYVAYLFAHNAGGFGLTGTDNVISCGLCTAGTFENLGYEPQWVMLKNPNSSGSGWFMFDNMRASGLANYVNQNSVQANSSGAESENGSISFSATGFTFESSCVYIAIRRGPMKVPTDGTKVFGVSRSVETSGQILTSQSGVLADAIITKPRLLETYGPYALSRLTGNANGLETSSTVAENTFCPAYKFDNNLYAYIPAGALFNNSGGFGQGSAVYSFNRASSFFDVVCYTGTGSARTVTHNLGVVPELMIVKDRSSTQGWSVYAQPLGATSAMVLQTTAAVDTGTTRWNSTAPTSTVFSLGSSSFVNANTQTFVAYLFASCPGVSKVGSFTGTGATQVIDCGFTGGARFVLIKATSTTGDWLVWDTARGMIPSNDPYLRLNTTAAEVTGTDWVDTAATGFELSNASGNSANTNGVSYIFLAIA